MAEKYRSFGVVGLGNFGSTVARELTRFGNAVIGLDIDENRVSSHADELSQALIVDARDEKAIKESGIGECDVVLVAMGSDLEASIITAINLKLVGVETIWAKARTKTHHRILSRLGVDRIVHPEVEVGQHVAQVLNNPVIRDFISLGNSYYVVNVRVPEALEGKTLDELDHRNEFSLRCLGVMRGTEFIGDDGKPCELRCDDLLLLLGKRGDLRRFAAQI